MLKSWPVFLIALALAVGPSAATAGQETLDSLIERALSRHPELAAANTMREADDEAARAAGALPDPMLSVGVMNLPSGSLALDETPMSGVSVGLTQTIPWPGKLRSRSALAGVKTAQSETTTEIVSNQIVREVADAYYEYSYWTTATSIIDDYLQLLTATRDVAEVRYANGDASAQDVLRAGTMVERTEVRLKNHDQKRQAALARLWRAVGDSSVFDGLPPDLPEPDVDGSQTGSFEHNPLLKNAELAVRSSEVRARLTRMNYYPDISFGVDYRFRKDVPGDPVHGEDFLTFRVGLNLPLWFFSKQKHQTSSATLMTRSSQEREQAVRETLASRMIDLRSRLNFTTGNLPRYDSTIVPQAEAAVEAAQVAYEVGKVDFNALLSAQSELLDVRLERLDLLRQYNQVRAAMTELSGAPYER